MTLSRTPLLPIIDLGTCAEMRRSITVNDQMQQDYRYERVEPAGRNFHPEFKPDLTPADMLRLGVFGGKYMTDCGDEFPASWFKNAKLASGPRDKSLNYFGVDASQPLSEWRREGCSNGTAGTTWGDECPTRTLGRSNAGRQSAVMCVSFSLRASLAMSGVAGANGRRCCTGRTMAASCEKAENSQVEHRVCIEIRCYLAPQPIWASSKPSNRRPALAPARVSSRCG
jgi:hypothetical protein